MIHKRHLVGRRLKKMSNELFSGKNNLSGIFTAAIKMDLTTKVARFPHPDGAKMKDLIHIGLYTNFSS